jgi:hypothetical protein
MDANILKIIRPIVSREMAERLKIVKIQMEAMN